ncbi:hypothetical protein VP01_96g4 [Puccinia sorghi]|uniref:Uncharacterized protein n=1 Tax=Puccinia sorghi TaxID=27349 RepID=A0A0L6U5Z1_9BASI|nr:hypothetical protein VP01_96g4 [Puccinia sorghi]
MSDLGPLASVAEFPGERLIGFLQKISTNNKIDEMHQTMVTRGSQLQRLMANPEYVHLSEVLDLDKSQAPPRRKKIRLLSSRYNLLFEAVAHKDRLVVHQDTFPVPRRHWVLSPDVFPIQSIACNGLEVGSMRPRNCVVAMVAGKTVYGLVRQCYQYENAGGQLVEFLVVETITNRYPKATEGVLTRPFRYLLFLFGTVVGVVEENEMVIWPSQVTCLAAYRMLGAGVFMIPENGIALVPRAYDAFLNITGHDPAAQRR